MAAGTGAELLNTAVGAIITVLLGAILGFFVWIVKTLQSIKLFMVQFQAETATRLSALEKKAERAERSMWSAQKELAALWPMIPGANQRPSDKIRGTRDGS